MGFQGGPVAVQDLTQEAPLEFAEAVLSLR
jgi:hypothetical protein